VAKVGRPARISREAIAEAANDLGLGDLTLRAVADRLGVSTASLYHHVESKEDLLRLAAEHSVRRTPIPHDEGQHWAAWLLAWARYNRDAFAADPALLGQYLDGAISAEVIAENTEAILAPMVRQGFTAAEAQGAYQLVSSCAIGSAIHAIREQRAAAAGRQEVDAYRRLVAERGETALPNLRDLLAEVATGRLDDFEERIRTVLAGIATRRGDDWSKIQSQAGIGPRP
jgi:AcrR family transcriptional regulator